ncbi:hypothetical protein RV11_GL001375 [Enterococcus phoeniculicola]|jgi:uncharacterized membrane protein YkoI|uniref:PepSY domain-containing protein n=1 Tax=Enterococcus phoeniculicola ATCC BAA-412 TaxID=1158610 RepID=R3WNU7_9ENTE|nr:PepSY domain-containing protein [Enterococcus phoeniculicola]EOL49117.1 hypothetical protein UC3_00212 [Enterococcus phoeniculicola ATCC BAA-412]EOT70930.1 hypothetical protein I589_03414 [Enterococcus phoeniculicola ATCC BAA-412]OJG70507.1 hypothetical protein RV11_GL001375 [Enterococcus phoeniculicola]
MKKISLMGVVLLGMVLSGCTSNQNTLPEKSNSLSAVQETQKRADSETSHSRTEDSSSNTKTSNTTNQSTTSSQPATNTEGIDISLEKAISIYQDLYPDTAVTTVDLDTSFGKYYYEVKGVDDSMEYEVKIDAKTGEAKKEKEERLDSDEQNGVEKDEKALSLDKLLAVDKAAEVAVKAAGGGEAIEWSLEREWATTYWEVTVKNGRSETTVTLDAKTGEILETELDD